MSDGKNLLNGMLLNYLGALIIPAVTLCQSAFSVRFLDSDIAGICLFFLGLNSFLNLCDFGISTILARELSFTEHNPHKIYRKNLFFSAALSVNKTLSLSLLLFLGMLLLYLHFSIRSLNENTVLLNAGIFILAFGFRLLSNPYTALMYGLKRVDLQKILSITSSLLSFFYLCCMIFIFSIKNFYVFSTAIFIQYLFLFLTSKLLAKRLLILKKKLPSKLHRQFLLASGLKVFMISLGAYFIFQINPPVIAYYLGPEKLVEFMPIFQILTSAMSLCFLTQTASLPFIASKFSQQGFKSIHSSVLFFLKLNVGLIIVVVVYLNFCGDSFFRLWLGSTYVLNKSLLAILSIMIVLETQHVTIASVVMNCGYIAFIRPALLAGILNILFLIVFLPKFGVIGVGFSIMLAQLLTNNWFVVYKSIKILQLNLKFFLVYSLRVIFFLILLSGGALFIHKEIHTSTVLSNTILSILVLGAFALILGVLILLSKDEKYRVQKLFLSSFPK